jgi:hypothetical protein
LRKKRARDNKYTVSHNLCGFLCYRAHKRRCLYPILSQMNPVYNFTPHLFRANFNFSPISTHIPCTVIKLNFSARFYSFPNVLHAPPILPSFLSLIMFGKEHQLRIPSSSSFLQIRPTALHFSALSSSSSSSPSSKSPPPQAVKC